MTTQERGPLSEAEVRDQVAAIWHDVLGASDGNDDATFFELNGQSISAVRIAARIEEAIGVQVDMGDLFEDPDLATFTGEVLAKAQVATATADR